MLELRAVEWANCKDCGWAGDYQSLDLAVADCNGNLDHEDRCPKCSSERIEYHCRRDEIG